MPQNAPECPERFDKEFLKWVWNFPTRSRPVIVSLLNEHAESKKVIITKTGKFNYDAGWLNS